MGIDGRYVMFYERRAPQPTHMATTAPPTTRRRQPVLDGLMQEMVETLRSIGIQNSDAEIVDAIRRRFPQGLSDERFEIDVLLVRADLMRPTPD